MKILIALAFVVVLLFFSTNTTAQTATPAPTVPDVTKQDAGSEILNINTALIQAGVAVVDQNGQFVGNLKQDDFELAVDGKPVSISFFESHTLQKTETSEAKSAKKEKDILPGLNSTKSSVVGRNIIFVVDDFHLSFDSTNRTRKLIEKFVEQEMLPEDTVAVVSPSGRIGFLQQFTDDKTVIRAASERLIYSRDRSANDRLIPPMTEYEALLISQYDIQVTDIFAGQELGDDIQSKRDAVRARARSILIQAAAINRGTYSTLEQAIRHSAQLPGRKIVFFISDGLLIDPSNTDSGYLLQRIADAAVRTNTVIFSLDSRGLEAGFPEGGSTAAVPSIEYRVQSGEQFDRQDILSLLADKTGGKFIKNTNDLQTGLTNSIREASQFYLLAWEPSDENGKSDKLKKIEVRVKNRPELKIRVQSGYLSEKAQSTFSKSENKVTDKRGEKNESPVTTAQAQLNSAVNAPLPIRFLPTSLTVNFLNISSEGAVLAATIQVKGNQLEFTSSGDTRAAEMDILGAVYNSDGKSVGYFKELVKVETEASKLNSTNRPNIYYNYQKNLKPGLYQMRVAARDRASGQIGSAIQWIEIPDLSSKKLTLSSLMVSEQANDRQKPRTNDSGENAIAQLLISVDRIFNQSSQIRYLIFIYNAVQKPNPDVTIQTQVLRGKETVLSSAVNPISVEGRDANQLPYAAAIPLNGLSPGKYDLSVTVNDRIAKTAVTKKLNFEVR